MPNHVFDVRNLTYRYQTNLALQDLSLQIPEGKHIALLGPNGSGKSTLLRLLDGLCFAEKGSVLFYDQLLDPRRFEDDDFHFMFRRRVGLVFQNPDIQLFNPTVFDEVAFAPLQMQWSAVDVREKVATILDHMEIAHLKDRPPHRLSGGEKKRVALASVLVLDPDILLLDEPTSALDPRSESQIIDLLMSWDDGRKTVITATHDLGLSEDIADECFLLSNGRLVAHGTPRDIVSNTELLESVNLIHAHRHRHESGQIHSHPHSHPHRHD